MNTAVHCLDKAERGIRRMPAPFDFDDDAVEQALEEQLWAFRAKFGRDPGPDDPLFFDPDADEPRPLNRVAVEAGMVDAMERAGISPAQIYAFQQTGIIPVEGLLDRVPAERLQEFYLAVRRYERLHLSAEENAEIDVAEPMRQRSSPSQRCWRATARRSVRWAIDEDPSTPIASQKRGKFT